MIIKGAIFDVDGTLLDSMSIWENVAADYLRSIGATPSLNLNEELKILGGIRTLEYLQAEYGLRESKEEIRAGINGLLEDFYFNAAQPKDGAVDVLNTLRGRGVKMCVATATDKYLIEPALKRCGILDYFGYVFTCGEERTSKSRPDIYLRAAEFLGTPVHETPVFEDALYAVKSAKGAGFPVVGVYDIWARGDEKDIRSLCDVYIESWAEFAL